MQSLIHGNFEGAARKKAYALVGAAAAIAAAVGPLLGGFVTTYLSWRVGFAPRGRDHRGRAVAASSSSATCRTPALARSTWSAPSSPSSAWAASSSASWSGRKAASPSALLIAIGAVGLALLAYWLVTRKRQGKLTLLDPDLFRFPHFRIGISQQMLQQITLGGAMIALPIFLQMTLEYNAMEAGLSLAPLSLSMFAVAMLAGTKAGKRRPSNIVRSGFALSTVGMAAIIPIVPRADSGWCAGRSRC